MPEDGIGYVRYDPTPRGVAEAMFDAVGLKKDETLLDLGSGCGHMVIPAAQRGARAVGVEKNFRRYMIAKERVSKLGLSSRVDLYHCPIEEYLAEKSLGGVDVVATFLSFSANCFIAEYLFRGLPPHARVVSNDWPYPWTESETRKVEALGHMPYEIFFYRMSEVRQEMRSRVPVYPEELWRTFK